ncbi:putative iron reductase [Moniliophthora roreri MCA 2997]|uniref:ferric-chelate reductase (NADPH) n=1 Tax=Moniliophthora roreri (strain MCA 2997) TaxID=1381753 RepID=V2XI32_MONRO|nr:putative iron reductase [Moniliophthora roreri MCA 2997]
MAFPSTKEGTTAFGNELLVRAARAPNPDRTIRIMRTREYPKQIWYFLSCFIALVSFFQAISFLVRRYRRSGTSGVLGDSEKGPREPSSGSRIQWRRLPYAVANLYRIVAFRSTVTMGSYSLNLAEVLVTFMYIIALFTWTFIRTTSSSGVKFQISYWANRSGVLASSQFPLITVLGTKNNALSLITGISYEKLNYLHRMTARVVFVLLCLHAGSRIRLGVDEDLGEHWFQMGVTAGCAFLLLCLVSVRPLRARSYELFFYSHMVLVLLILVGAYSHTAQFHFQKYVLPCLLIWGLDRFIRGIRLVLFNYSYFSFSSSTRTSLDANVELLSPDCVRLTLKRPPHFHWSAGQTAYLIMPTVSTLPFEAHPFTIASIDFTVGTATTEEGDSPPATPTGEKKAAGPSFCKELIFLINPRGGVTKRLAEAAEKEVTIKTYIDGPYGHSPDLSSYDTSVFVAGGSGVSYTLPMFLVTVKRVRDGTSRCRKVTFIWCIRGSESIHWISEALGNTILLAPRSLDMSICIFVTRAESQVARLANTENISPTSSTNPLGTATSILLNLPPNLRGEVIWLFLSVDLSPLPALYAKPFVFQFLAR